MLSPDFYGKKGFVWWVGIVEDDQDPLEIGSVRVRIIGLHSPDKNLVPTDSLPWAQVLYPPNSSKTLSVPRPSDWVLGFFQDGEQAQIPVVMGVFAGVESLQAQDVYQTSPGFALRPRPPAGIVFREEGEPTTSRLSRGLLPGTLVNEQNSKLKHVCDISPEVQWAVGHVKGVFAIVIEKLRKAIRGLLITLGADPSGEVSKVVQLAKEVASEIKKITKEIQLVAKEIAKLVALARQLRAMIDYILSLPDKLRKFLAECLQKFTQAIAQGIGNILASPKGLSLGGDFAELSKALKEVRDSSVGLLREVGTAAAIPAAAVQVFLTPSSPQDIAKAEKQFKGFLSTIPPASQVLSNNTSGQPNPGDGP